MSEGTPAELSALAVAAVSSVTNGDFGAGVASGDTVTEVIDVNVVADGFASPPSPVAPVRFLHTADWQLGMTRYFLPAEAQARYAAARVDAIVAIGRVAVRERCEFVVVCGDVFETNQVAPRVVRRALEAMAGVPVPVLLLPGNHDPLDASSVFRSREFLAACPANVRVLTEPFRLRPGVEVVPAPWPSKRPSTDLVARAIGGLPVDGTIRIVAGHGALDVLSADPAAAGVIALAPVEAGLRCGAVHYVALGDRHSLTALGSGGRIRYSGTPEVTAFDEVEPGQVLVVQVGPDRAEVRPVAVGEWTFRELSFVLHGAADVAAVDSALSALPGKDRTAVRLVLSGALTPGEHGRLDQLLADHEHVFASLRRHPDSVLGTVADRAELDQLGLSGYALDAAAELAALAADQGPLQATATDALRLLHRLTGAGR